MVAVKDQVFASSNGSALLSGLVECNILFMFQYLYSHEMLKLTAILRSTNARFSASVVFVQPTRADKLDD